MLGSFKVDLSVRFEVKPVNNESKYEALLRETRSMGLNDNLVCKVANNKTVFITSNERLLEALGDGKLVDISADKVPGAVMEEESIKQIGEKEDLAGEMKSLDLSNGEPEPSDGAESINDTGSDTVDSNVGTESENQPEAVPDVDSVDTSSELGDMNDLKAAEPHGPFIILEKDQSNTDVALNLILEDKNGKTCRCSAYFPHSGRLRNYNVDDVILLEKVKVKKDSKNYFATSTGLEIVVNNSSNVQIIQQLRGGSDPDTLKQVKARDGRKATLLFMRSDGIREVASDTKNRRFVQNSYWETKGGETCQLAIFDTDRSSNLLATLPADLNEKDLCTLSGMKILEKSSAHLNLAAKKHFLFKKKLDTKK